MKNFLIFLAVAVVVLLAAIDIKDRLNELETIYKTHQSKYDFHRGAENKDIDLIKKSNKH